MRNLSLSLKLVLRTSFLCMLSLLRVSYSFKASTLHVFRRNLSLLHADASTEVGGVVDSSFSSRRDKNKSGFQTVLLKRSRHSKSFRNGNPLIFTPAIKSVPSNVKVGDLVLVAVEEKSDQTSSSVVPLGYGVYNPNSLYRIRILCHRFLQPSLYNRLKSSSSSTGLATILRHHLQTCVLKRRALNLPNAQTDTFRLVNGEGDSLSGLAIDVIGVKKKKKKKKKQQQPGGDGDDDFRDAVAVVMSSAAWCQVHQEVIENIILQSLPGLQSLIWKTTPSRLIQDGYYNDSVHDVIPNPTNVDRAVIARENGVLFKTRPFADGQKTGVYCDQRENRLNLSQLCQDKRVLDLCCYHGGFALNALVNGQALSATAVDSSQDAIATCMENARLNGCEYKLECVAADISAFLQESHGRGREYDVVVLDPPKLAPTSASLEKARRKYHGLNRDAIKVVSSQKGGLFLTCTCSAAMTQKDGGQYFLAMVSGAGLAAGRSVTLLRVSGAASCHTQAPVAWPSGSYLTAALFYVHPTLDDGETDSTTSI